MEVDFLSIDFDALIMHLMQLLRQTVSGLTLQSAREFPALFCRELALCSHEQLQLVLIERDDFKSKPLFLQGLKTFVEGGRRYGTLILLSPPREPDDLPIAISRMQMLALVCGLMLWLFELTCSVQLSLHSPDGLQIASLSPREQKVLQLLCQGWRFQEIAQRLDILEATVERHQRGIRAKLREPDEPKTAYALEASVLAYLAGFFSPLTDLQHTIEP